MKVTVTVTSSVSVWQLGEAGREAGEEASIYDSYAEMRPRGEQRYGAEAGWHVE